MNVQLKIALGAAVIASAFAAAHLGVPSTAAAAGEGKAIFESRCASCHQAAGEGISGTFPPLAGNKDVTAANPTRIIGIVLHGLNTPITVKGTQYNGGMPPWKGALTNADIAAVLTYVRSSWGNKAKPVTEKQVAAVK